MTPLQLALLSLRTRERKSRDFVERMDAARLAYASIHSKEADASYRRVRRDLLSEVEAPQHTARRETKQLEFPLPAMFAGAPPEMFENIRIIQRRK